MTAHKENTSNIMKVNVVRVLIYLLLLFSEAYSKIYVIIFIKSGILGTDDCPQRNNHCRSRRDESSITATTVLQQEMRSWTRSVLLICIEAIACRPMPLVVLLSIYFNKSKGIHQRISQSKQNPIRAGMG